MGQNLLNRIRSMGERIGRELAEQVANEVERDCGGAILLDEGYITEHFTWREFRSGDGVDVPPDLRDEVTELCQQLEKIRERVNERWPIVNGDRGLVIHSGYRTKAFNAKVGGATGSQHKLGTAADIHPTGPRVDMHELAALIKGMIDDGEILPGGLKAYQGPKSDGTVRETPFVHYDIRGYYVSW